MMKAKEFTILLFGALFLIACSDNDEYDKVVFPSENNDLTFAADDLAPKTFTFDTTDPWLASVTATPSDILWLEVNPSSGPAGKNQQIKISITDTENSAEERSAEVTISAGGERKSFKVTQSATSDNIPFLSISPNEITFGFDETSEKTVTIETNQSEISCSLSSNDPDLQHPSDWLTITLEEKTIKIIPTVNFGGGTRSAFVTVEAGNAAPKTFTVIQSFKLGTAAGIETALIPAGNFMMGSPQTEADRNSTETEYPHQVTLTSAFRMSKHEISNARYAAFLNDRKVPGVKQSGWSDYIAASYTANYNGYRELLRATKDTSHDWGLHWDADKEMWTPAPGMDDYPVIYVTWFGADEFARWAGGNLPTEAQWEYSCRGNNGTAPFGVGTGNELYSDMANFNGRYPYELPDGVIQSFEGTEEHANTNLQRTCEIGTFLPNSYGLYDMHGNVAEWCADWFEEYYGSTAGASVTDPTGPETGNLRSIRGGSWDLLSDKCRSAYRTGSNPDVTCLPQIGFRIVLPAGN